MKSGQRVANAGDPPDDYEIQSQNSTIWPRAPRRGVGPAPSSRRTSLLWRDVTDGGRTSPKKKSRDGHRRNDGRRAKLGAMRPDAAIRTDPSRARTRCCPCTADSRSRSSVRRDGRSAESPAHRAGRSWRSRSRRTSRTTSPPQGRLQCTARSLTINGQRLGLVPSGSSGKPLTRIPGNLRASDHRTCKTQRKQAAIVVPCFTMLVFVEVLNRLSSLALEGSPRPSLFQTGPSGMPAIRRVDYRIPNSPYDYILWQSSQSWRMVWPSFVLWVSS